MKTIVQKLGKSCRRWLLALSLAWVGIGIIDAATTAFYIYFDNGISSSNPKLHIYGNGYDVGWIEPATFSEYKTTSSGKWYYGTVSHGYSNLNNARICVIVNADGDQEQGWLTVNYSDATLYLVRTSSSASNVSESTANSTYGLASGPSAPTNLTATVNGNAINLSWSLMDGAAGYTVYRSNSANGTYNSIGTTTNTSYTDNKGTGGTTYYYKVEAYASKNAFTIRTDSYGQVTDGMYVYENEDNKLHFKTYASTPTVANNPEAFWIYDNGYITNYGSGKYVGMNNTEVASVSGSSTYGTNPYEAYTSATPANDANFKWTFENFTCNDASGTDKGGTAYVIRLTSSGGVDANSKQWASGRQKQNDGLVAVPTINKSTFTGSCGRHWKKENETSVNVAYGDKSDDASATYPSSAPAAPTGLTATANSASQITLSWTDSANATGYKVYDNNGNQITANITIEGTTAVITGLTANTSYTYKVKATSAGGDSDFSSPASATTFVSVPSAPNVTISNVSSSHLNLNWGAVTNAEKYEIYRKVGNEAYGATPYKVIDASVTSFTDNNLTFGTQYCYKLKTVGNNSANSVTVGAMDYNYNDVHAEGENGVAFTQNQLQPDGRHNAGNIDDNEWARYTVNVPVAGTYDVSLWMARDQGLLTAYLNDEPNKNTPLASFVSVPTSSNWQNYNEYKSSITLAAGENTIYFVAGSGLNLWKMVFSRGAQSSDFSTEQCATTTVPPANVTLTPLSESSIQVAWDLVDGATEYKVYRNTNATNGDGTTAHNYTCVTTKNAFETSFTDTGLATGTTYYYTVSAVVGGEETDRTLPKSMAPIEAVPVLVAEPDGEDVQLTWTDSGTDSPTFRVLRSSTENGTYEVVAIGQTSSYTDTDAAAKLYYYKVQAERTTVIGGMDWLDRSCGDLYNRDKGCFRKDNCSGKGNWCNAGGVDNDNWAKYTVYAAYAGTYDITAYLAAPDANAMNAYLNDTPDKTTPLTTFHKDAASGNWQTYDAIDGTVTLSAGANNIYFVAGRGLNFWKMELANNATPSAAVQAVLAAPANVTATAASTTSITVRWDAVDDATSYTVYKSTNGTTWDAGTNVNDTSYLHENLDVNTVYYYKVTATDGTDTSVPSAVATGVTCPDAPTSISVETYDNRHVDVSWTAVGNGTPYHVFANGSEITGFSNLGTDKTTHNGGADYQQLTETSARITLANSAKHYWFAVATVQVSPCQRVMSNVASTYTAPDAPTGLTAELAANGVLLSWTAPAAPPAGAYNYRVYRAASADGQYEQVLPAAQDPVITTTSAVDSTVSAGTVYYYKVVAVMQDVESAMTDAVVIRTQPAAIGGCDFNIDPTAYYRSSYNENNEDYREQSYNDADLNKNVDYMKKEEINYDDRRYYGSLDSAAIGLDLRRGSYILGYTNINRWVTYRINAAEEGTYRMTVVATDKDANRKLHLNLYSLAAGATFDPENPGDPLATINTTTVGGASYRDYYDYASGTFSLSAGVQDLVLMFASDSQESSIARIVFRKDLGTLGLTAKPIDDITVRLDWTNLGSGVTYTLERSNDDPRDNEPDGYSVRYTGSLNYYVDNDGPVRAHHYYYRLSAATADCASALTEVVDTVTFDQKVRIIGVNQEKENNETFLSITWSYAVDPNETQPTAYKVYRAPSNWVQDSDFEYIGQQVGSQQFYHDKTVGDNKEYCYKVSAYYGGGGSSSPSSDITDASRKYLWNGTTWGGYLTQFGMSASFNNNEVTLTNRGYSEGDNSDNINGQYNSGDYHVIIRAKSTQNGSQIGLALTGNAGEDMFTYAKYTTVTTEYAYYDLGVCNTFDGRTDYKFGFVIDTYTAPITISEAFVTNNPNLYSGGTEIAMSDPDCGKFHLSHLEFEPNSDIIETYQNASFTAEFTVKNNGSADLSESVVGSINFGATASSTFTVSSLASGATTTVSAQFTAPAAAGDYTVSAQLPNGETATRTVRVQDCTPATAIALDQAAATIYTGAAGNTVKLTPTVTPASGYCGEVTWASSDETVAKVNNDGVVTALAEGSATITASINGSSAICDITVSAPVEAASVELQNKPDCGAVGTDINSTVQLSVKVLASDGVTLATDQAVTWSSDDVTIATVDANGLVTAHKSGMTTIRVTSHDGSFTDYIPFITKLVKPTVTLTNITSKSASFSWQSVGELRSFVWVYPEDSGSQLHFEAPASEGQVGDTQSITIDTLNEVQTDLQPNTTYRFRIKPENNNWIVVPDKSCGLHEVYSDYVYFTTLLAPTSITAEDVVLRIGQQIPVVATVLPDGTSQDVTYTSGDTLIATVDANGVVTGIDEGSTTITITSIDDPTVTTTINVNVVAAPLAQPDVTVSEVGISSANLSWNAVAGANAYQITLYQGDCTTSSILVENLGNVNEYKLEGLNSETVYCVKVSALKKDAGGNITNRSEDFNYQSFTTLVAPTDIEISGPDKVYVGSTGAYAATVTPAEASQDVVWSIHSGSDYATVDAKTGVVTADSVGVITLRATSTVLSSVYADKNVTIQIATVEDMTLSRGSVYVLVGRTHLLPDVTFYPEGFDDTGVNWAGGNDTIATITGSTINGIAVGETTFTATSLHNSNVSAELTVYVIPTDYYCEGGSGETPAGMGEVDYATFVAGPFYIQNSWHQNNYLYDDQVNENYTETNAYDSTSDATTYTNMGHAKRTNGNNNNTDAGTTFATTVEGNQEYMWNVYSKVINSTTYYMIRNVKTGRYIHTGPFGDYYNNDGGGDNNSANMYAWNATLVGDATAIDGTNNNTKELSYYMHTLTGVTNGDFTSGITSARWMWGTRYLHAEENMKNEYTFYASKNPEYGTRSWNFIKVAEDECEEIVSIVDVDSFAVAPHYAEIYRGEAFQDTLKFTPNNATIQEVDWTVKGSSVEVSADGVITGVDMGTSTVYATTKDGRFVDSTIVRVLPSCDPMIVYTPIAPTMDGELDAIWDNAQPKAIMKNATLKADDVAPNQTSIATNIPAGFWRLMYTTDSLYVFTQVVKDPSTLSTNTSVNLWHRDAIEFYVYTGENNTQADDFKNFVQLGIDCMGNIELGNNGKGKDGKFTTSGVKKAVVKTASGYNVEFAIPWSAFENIPEDHLFMEMAVDQADANGVRTAQVTTYQTSSDLWQNVTLLTRVEYFKLQVPDTYIVDESTPTVIHPDVTGVESFRWVKLVNGEETETLSNRQDLIVNTTENMKVRLYVTQKGSCFTTYQDIDIKLSDVYLLSTPTGEEAVSETESKNISSGKGNKMSSVNCNGEQGEYSGDYAMLYLVPANTNLRSSLDVQYEGNDVDLANVNGAEATPNDGNSHWVRYLYTATDDTHGTLNIGVFPENADVKLYNNSGDSITVDYKGDTFSDVRDGYIYTWTISGTQFGEGVYPKLDGTDDVWGSTNGVKPAATDGLKYKVTYNLLTNCMEIKELMTYGLTIGEGEEESATVAFNEAPDLESDGDFYIKVPCVQTMATLCYRVANTGNELTDWKNLDYYTIDLSEFAGKMTKVPFSYMNREEWGITPVSEVFGEPSSNDNTASRITITGIPVSTQTTADEICPTVTGVSDNAVYYWMKSVGSGDYEISYIPQDSTCFTPDAGYNESEPTHYYLQVVDGYCSQRSGIIDYQLAYTPSASPDLAVNNLSVDWANNTIVSNVQNYGENNVTNAQYTLKYTILNITDETSRTITASTAVKRDMPRYGGGENNYWTWSSVGDYTFNPNKAYQVTATIAFTSAFIKANGDDAVPSNNSRTVDVCTFVPGDTVYYTIKNTLVNNVDSLCTLHFKTIGGALKHLKSPEGYLSQSGTTRTLTKPVVFNVYYTGTAYTLGTDEVTLFGGLSDNLKSTQAFLFENINSGANAENAFIIRAAEHGLRPEVSHFIVRKSRNVIIENLEIEGSVAGDNALDIDDGKLIYFGSTAAGEFDDANVTVRDCKITANGNATAAVVVSGVSDVTLTNNVIWNEGADTSVDGASLKLVNAADIYVLRNNIYGSTKNVVWVQNSVAANMVNNVIWNRGVADGSLVALFNRADGQNSVGGKLSLYYNTLVVNNSAPVDTKFLDVATAKTGMTMGGVDNHTIRLMHNNMYSISALSGDWYTKAADLKIANSDLATNNIRPGTDITPSDVADDLGGVADNYISQDVIYLFSCGPTQETDFPLSNASPVLNVGAPLASLTNDAVLTAVTDDRLRTGVRASKENWTLGAHQADVAGDEVHSIIWTNYTGDCNWDNYANWTVEETKQQLNCTNTFASDLKAIIPSIAGSKYVSESVTRGAKGYYPTLDSLPVSVRITASGDKVVDTVLIEYGGALPIDKFVKKAGSYGQFKTSLVMKGEDRVNEDWILVGPNIRPANRQMLSGDYYKDLLPKVYMHQLQLDESTSDRPNVTWNAPFKDMTVEITQNEGFAIQAPDQYSKWAYPATIYYRNQLSRWEAGSEDLEWTFTGTLEQDVNAPLFSAEADQWTLMTNTFMGNIDVKNLISEVTEQLGGETQISVWSFNNDGSNTYGSFATHNSASESGVKIKPQHVFFCYNTIGGDITLPESVCDFTTPTTYKDFTQGVAPSYKPTLEIRSLNGRYSSVTSIVYDAYLEEEQLGSKEFNLMKLFTGYAQTPDICSYYGADALYSQTINPSIKEVPLGVKAGEELKAVFEFSGAEDFKEVYLEDRLFGKRYDLKNTESLEFDLTEGYNQGRFYVIFEFDELDEPTTDLNESAASEIRIYTEDNENVVVSSEGADLVRIQMIDMSGKQQNIKVKSDRYNLINMSSYPAGVYTFKASTTDRTKVEKVVIK